MSKSALTANAEGMPAINRRRLLLGLAAASTVAVVPVAMASVQPMVPVENPELVKLGNELPAIEAEYVDAYATRLGIVHKWSAHWPLASDEISHVCKRWDSISTNERTLDGFALTRPGEEWGRAVECSESIGQDLDGLHGLRRALRRKRRDPFAPINWRGCSLTIDQWAAPLSELETKHSLTLAYEAEKARVLELSGFVPARDRETAAREALAVHVERIMAQSETSMTGIVIKAQALGAWGKVEPFFRALTVGASAWGPALGAAVLRIASGETA